MSSSKVFDIDENTQKPCVYVSRVNPRYEVTVIDLNGVPKRVDRKEAVYDGETVRAITREQPIKDVEPAYTVSMKFDGIEKDVMDMVVAAPVRYWRKDRFYVSGDVNNPIVGHVLVSQS